LNYVMWIASSTNLSGIGHHLYSFYSNVKKKDVSLLLLRGALYCLHFSITILKFSMNDPPLAKGDIGGFFKLLNPPLPPFSKGRDANKYMLRVIIMTALPEVNSSADRPSLFSESIRLYESLFFSLIQLQ
jgi:hypothetical protein